jgi:hypothetical protein
MLLLNLQEVQLPMVQRSSCKRIVECCIKNTIAACAHTFTYTTQTPQS